MQQLGQVELPLLAEVGELQQEPDRVIGLVQTGQALDRAHRVQTLQEREQSGGTPLQTPLGRL